MEKIPNKILIAPFISEGLEPAGYDIHLGESYLSHKSGKISKLRPGDTLVIESGEIVNVEFLEYIGLPQNIMALITPKANLVMKGISQISTHIDPGFHGKLFQTIVNLSNRKVKLKYGDCIAHITFFRVDEAKPALRYKGRHLKQTSLEKDPIREEVANNPGSIISAPRSYLELLLPGFLLLATAIPAFVAYALGKTVWGNLLAFPAILSIIALGLYYYAIRRGK